MTWRQRVLWMALGAVVTLTLIGGLRAARFVWVRRDRVVSGVARRLRPDPSPTPLAAQQTHPAVTFAPEPASTQASVPAAIRRLARRVLLPLIGAPPPSPSATASSLPKSTDTPAPKKSTKRPKPTSTPTLPWPEPLDQPGRSKLGIHVQWNNSPEIMEFVRRMRPPVVKAIGDFGFLAELKEASPTTVVVGRIEGQGEWRRLDPRGDPVARAQAYVNAQLADYLANPLVDYWEGPNEPDIRGHMPWYAAFEAERVRVMAGHGLSSAVGGFSAGVPEWEEFGDFMPAIAAARQHGGILTLHEYDAPTLDRSIGAGLPGHPNYPDRGSLALRYRWWYEDFIKPQGLVVPLVVSEAGIDGLISNRPGPEGGGWRDFASHWEASGLGNDPTAAYVRQLAWYDHELQRDDYVIGCTVFTAGAMSDDWASYDITAILRHIATDVMVPAAR